VEDLVSILKKITGGEARSDLIETTAANGRRLIEWLKSKDVRFMRFNQKEGYRWCMAPPRAMRAGVDWKDRGPDVMLRILVTQLGRLGGELSLRSRARTLIMDGGACVGVEGEVNGRHARWRGTHTIIADGGFQSSRELFLKHIGPGFESVFQRGAGTGVGDGLKMAEAVGASLTGTDRFYGHLLCAASVANEQLQPYPELDAIATAGIVVDETGKRVADEGKSGVYLTNMLAALHGRRRLFAVFDDAIWRGRGKSARIPANPLIEQAGGTVSRGERIQDLAAEIGVPMDALAGTITQYNDALRQGTLGQLDVARSTDIEALPIVTSPFMAIEIVPGITYTMGGITIDGQAQVLSTDGGPIPGLLAAGSATGGLEGGSGVAYIGGLLKAGTLGLVAAERAATLQNRAIASHGPASATVDERVGGDANRLSEFPVLALTLRFGGAAGILLGFSVALLILLTGWPSLGSFSIPFSLIFGIAAAMAILGCTELVRLIVDMLIPD
jgi:fumarate reductase flavoprotein subunit